MPPASKAAARVVAIASELQYEPNVFAASLRTQRSLVIGVLVPRLTDLAISTMYEGVEATASSLGYQTVVANTLDSPSEQRRRAEMLLSRQVDGLIFADALIENPYLDELAARDVPFVLMNRHHAPFDAVTSDDYSGGLLVGRHLAKYGHSKVGIVSGSPSASTGIDRASGCVEGLREHHIDVQARWIIGSEFTPRGGRDTTMRIMQDEADRPTAIFAVTDTLALGAMGALRDLGLRVAKDVAVVGFNDTTFAQELLVPLSSVRGQLMEVGNRVVHKLIERLDEAAPHKAVEERLACELIVRESSGFPRSGAP